MKDVTENKTRSDIDPNSLCGIFQGFQQIDSGFQVVVNALAGSNNRDTVIFKKVCDARDNMEALKNSLKPSILI